MKILTAKTTENINTDIDAILKTDSTKSAKMTAMFELGLDIKTIAAVIGVRYNFVYNVIQNFVIKNDIATETETKISKKAIIKELAAAGKTKIEIAKTLKVDYNYVWQTLNQGE